MATSSLEAMGDSPASRQRGAATARNARNKQRNIGSVKATPGGDGISYKKAEAGKKLGASKVNRRQRPKLKGEPLNEKRGTKAGGATERLARTPNKRYSDADGESDDSASDEEFRAAASDEIESNRAEADKQRDRTKTKYIAEKARRLSVAKHRCQTPKNNGAARATFVTSTLKRDSTYVKPEPSLVGGPSSAREDKGTGAERTEARSTAEVDEGEESASEASSEIPYKVVGYVFDRDQRNAAMESSAPEEDGNQTIEDVASNFMKRFEMLENENVSLLDDNRRLLDKLKSAEKNEERLVNEVHVLKREHAELTIEYHNVKDDNLGLIRRLADVTKEKETLKKALEEEKSSWTEKVKTLEEEKAKLKQALDDTEAVLEEMKAKVATTESAMTAMKKEVKRLREENEKYENSKEKEQLQASVKEKEQLIQDLKRELKDKDELKNNNEKLKLEIKSLQKELKIKDSELSKNDDYIASVEKEKSLLGDELTKLRAMMKTQSTEMEDLRKKKESLSAARKSLEKTISNLKTENESLKATQDKTERREEEMEDFRAEIKELKSKLGIMKTTERAMSDLLLSKQNHIADLRNENAELRNANKLHKQELDELRVGGKEKSVIFDKYGDIADSHRRLLAENKRLRSLMANKAMQETNAASERSELEAELEETDRKLRKAQKRIAQLESWMDDIYSGNEYVMIPKGDDVRGSVLSLPEIPLLDTSRSTKSTGRAPGKRKRPVERITARSLAAVPR